MKYFLILCSIALLSFTTISGWNTDYETAKKQAEKENKFILLNFSGSDWCGNCMKLEKELFSTDTFKNYAYANAILLNADFPTKKKNKLSQDRVAQNEALAQKYNPDGEFPKTIILDSKGNKIGEMKYPCMGANEYIENIKKQVK